MNIQFRSFLRPPASLIERLEACDPPNPYANAHESLVSRLFVGLYSHNDLQSGCLGVLSGSFLRRNLHIRSLSTVPAPAVFWRGVAELCPRVGGLAHADRYLCLTVGGEIPQPPGELERLTRWKYMLDWPTRVVYAASTPNIVEIFLVRLHPGYPFVEHVRHPPVSNTWRS